MDDIAYIPCHFEQFKEFVSVRRVDKRRDVEDAVPYERGGTMTGMMYNRIRTETGGRSCV
jgi:hypothetical protein